MLGNEHVDIGGILIVSKKIFGRPLRGVTVAAIALNPDNGALARLNHGLLGLDLAVLLNVGLGVFGDFVKQYYSGVSG